MNFWEPCWACRVVSGELRSGIVTETADVVVAINPFPLSHGHALVLPKSHIQNLYEMPDELAGPILSMAALVARSAKKAFAAQGITLRQNNEAASDQHLFHFHLHVIPRHEGDKERFNQEPEQISDQQQSIAATSLRSVIEALRDA
jgi:histidine triad (HIT) family protein